MRSQHSNRDLGGSRLRSWLTGSAAGLALLASPAWANTVNGAPVTGQTITANGSPDIVVNTQDVYGWGSIGRDPFFFMGSFSSMGAIEVYNARSPTIRIEAGRIVGAHNSAFGIFLNYGRESSELASPTIINNGDIYGDMGGIGNWQGCGRLCPPGELSSASLSGTGRVFGGVGFSVRDSITIDGLSLISSRGSGLSAITAAGAGRSTVVNIGQTTRLGEIIAGTREGATLTARTINARFSKVTAGTQAILLTAPTGNLTGDATILFNGALTALTDGIASTRDYGLITIDGEGTGSILANRFGIVANAASGAFNNSLTVRNIASIQAGQSGVFLASITGNLNVDGVGSINAGTQAIWASTLGNVRVGQTTRPGHMTAGAYGILLQQPFAQQTATANIDLRLTSLSAGLGIFANNVAANTRIDFTGTLTGGAGAIYLFDYLGPVTVEGNGTGSLSGQIGALTVYGRAAGNGSELAVRNVATINGGNGNAIASFNNRSTRVSSVGSISSQLTDGIVVAGAGAETAQFDGISSISAGGNGITVSVAGDVLIGTVTPLGTITSLRDGIWSVASSSNGTFSLISNNNITATNLNASGVMQSGGRAVSVVVGGGTIWGPAAGMKLSSEGTLATFIGPGATIQGNTGLVVTLQPAAGSNVGTISNSGVIRTTVPLGTGAALALSVNGQFAINNFGSIIGRIASGPVPFGPQVASVGFYNKFGGVWQPGAGTNSFGGAADVIGNEGTIDLSGGTATLSGLEGLFNNSTGRISFHGAASTDVDLNVSGAFVPQASSRIAVQFDPTAAQVPTGLDRGGFGTANTIIAGTVTPQGLSWIDMALTAPASSITALTGSVALVATGSALPAPTPGTALVPSTRYAFGTGAPTSTSRTFALVEDTLGGVFLQWVPTIGAGTVGGFAGGAIKSGAQPGGGLDFLQASLAGATQASAHVVGMTAHGAAFGGAGAAGASCGGSDAASFAVRTGAWGDSGSQAGSGARASGRDLSFSPEAGSDGCGQVSLGVFRFGGTSAVGTGLAGAGAPGLGTGSDHARGTSEGVGGYMRADSGSGFYAQLTGASGVQRARVSNGLFGTTATVDSRLGMVEIAGGYTRQVTEGLALDGRVSATRIGATTEPFRDSLGFQVTRIETRADSLAVTGGLLWDDGANSGFLRAGVRATDAQQDGLAYGIRTRSSDASTEPLFEAGWSHQLGESASLDLAVTSDGGGGIGREEASVQLRMSW